MVNVEGQAEQRCLAYIGVGASQELPYPGKLRLRGDVAERDADMKQAESEVTEAEALVGDLSLDKLVLKDIASGNF
jgi:hypothetical protein